MLGARTFGGEGGGGIIMCKARGAWVSGVRACVRVCARVCVCVSVCVRVTTVRVG